MTIRHLPPEEVKVLIKAFEESLKALSLVDREEFTTCVAKKVVEAAQGGERDPQQLRTSVLAQFGASVAA
jgi:hypothetical protein